MDGKERGRNTSPAKKQRLVNGIVRAWTWIVQLEAIHLGTILIGPILNSVLCVPGQARAGGGPELFHSFFFSPHRKHQVVHFPLLWVLWVSIQYILVNNSFLYNTFSSPTLNEEPGILGPPPAACEPVLASSPVRPTSYLFLVTPPRRSTSRAPLTFWRHAPCKSPWPHSSPPLLQPQWDTAWLWTPLLQLTLLSLTL